MAEDRSNRASEKDDFVFNEAACSAEFSNEGCKFPADEETDEK